MALEDGALSGAEGVYFVSCKGLWKELSREAIGSESCVSHGENWEGTRSRREGGRL